MILENTFTSMENVVNHLIPKISIFTKMILKNKWKSDENIQKIHSPILFIKCNYVFIKIIIFTILLYLAGMDDLIPCIMIDQLREKAIKSKFIHTV